MSLRRLHHEQPESFAFTPANAEWAKRQIAKYPEGRQASAVIPLLWRGQEQEGWVSKPMIEEVASMLDMAEIRVLEVATFYFMFQLQPVGSVAHIQVCGTTSCMICGAEDLIGVCKEKIAPNPHEISPCGKFSWEEVECLGACANAPMAQIGKDYYEDLTAESFATLIDAMARGEVPKPGPQNGRWASEPISGLTSLSGDPVHTGNASVDIAAQLGDSIKFIDGTDPVPTWSGVSKPAAIAKPGPSAQDVADKVQVRDVDLVSESPLDPAYTPDPEEIPHTEQSHEGPQLSVEEDSTAQSGIHGGHVDELVVADDRIAGASEELQAVEDEDKPQLLAAAREGGPDDLKLIKGVGPKLEGILHDLGIFHFDQIATWSPREIAWVDDRLKFKGRIERDEWIDQAKILAAGGETEFSKRSK